MPVELLPLPEVARLLCLPWAGAWSLLLRGILNGEKRHGRWYVRAESVEQYRRERAAAEASDRAPVVAHGAH